MPASSSAWRAVGSVRQAHVPPPRTSKRSSPRSRTYKTSQRRAPRGTSSTTSEKHTRAADAGQAEYRARTPPRMDRSTEAGAPMTERVLLISSDCHINFPVARAKEYLPRAHHDAYDAWMSARFTSLSAAMMTGGGDAEAKVM